MFEIFLITHLHTSQPTPSPTYPPVVVPSTKNPTNGPSNPPTPRPSLRPSVKPTPNPTSGSNVCCTNRNLGYQTCDTNNWCNASSNNCNTCGGVVMTVPLERNGCCTWVSIQWWLSWQTAFSLSHPCIVPVDQLPNREEIAPLGIQKTTVAASTSNLTVKVTVGELGSSFKARSVGYM